MRDSTLNSCGVIAILVASTIICFAIYIILTNEKSKTEFETRKVTTVGIATEKQIGAYSGCLHYQYAVKGKKYSICHSLGLVEMYFYAVPKMCC